MIPASSPSLRTLVIGSTVGMEPAVGAAAEVSGEMRLLASLAELPTLPEGFIPDLVVICRHWPDEYPPTDVERLIAAFPLARLVCSDGPWCASAGRTRNIWPAAVRVPVEESAARIRLEARVIRGEVPPLPLTAGLDEAFAFDAMSTSPRHPS